MGWLTKNQDRTGLRKRVHEGEKEMAEEEDKWVPVCGPLFEGVGKLTENWKSVDHSDARASREVNMREK